MGFADHIQTIKFNLVYRGAAPAGVLATQRLRASVLYYNCFSIVQQKRLAAAAMQLTNLKLR